MLIRLKKDQLLKHGSMLMLASLVAHFCNASYQLVMGNKLSDVEFSYLAALLAVINISGLPLSTVGISLTRYCAQLVQEGREGDVFRLAMRWLFRMGMASAVFGVLCILFRDHVSVFLHLNRSAPVTIMAIAMVALFCAPVVNGSLLGIQSFKWLMLVNQLGPVIKLGVGIALVCWVTPAAGWALSGHLAGNYVLLGVSFVALLCISKGKNQSTTRLLPSLSGYTAKAFVVFLAYAVLMMSDVILVQHFLPEDAGCFAKAATIARMVTFLPMSFAMAMFPKVVSGGEYSDEHQNVLLRSLLYTALCTVPAALACTVFPRLPLYLIGMRSPDTQVIAWMIALAWVMVPIALLNVVVHFQLAQHRFTALYPLVVAALIYPAAVAAWHHSVWNVIITCGVLSLVCLLICMIRRSEKSV